MRVTPSWGIFEVYKEKGNRFVEPVYQECLELELAAQKIPFTAQGALRLTYKGTELKQRYIPDFLCYGKIILEIKAVKQLTTSRTGAKLSQGNWPATWSARKLWPLS